MAQSKPMGRPTKYNAEIQAKAEEYIVKLPADEVVHSVEGLADYINVSRFTVYKWRDEIEDFSNTLEKVLRKQAKTLMNRGLTGEFNAPITKMMMNVNHGYRERAEVDNLSTDGSMTPKTIERIIVQAENI
jgi:ACT domain-containing protein